MTTQQASGRVPDLTTFAARLALVRWQQGWNLKEAAIACGLPQNSWREWEVAGRLPRDFYGVSMKISDRTGVDVIWIMTGQVSAGGPDDGGGSGLTNVWRSYEDGKLIRCSPHRSPMAANLPADLVAAA